MFRLMGKKIDNSVYLTLYGLGKVAESFKQIGPYHTPIQHDRTKVWSLSKRWAEKPTSQLRIKEKMGW